MGIYTIFELKVTLQSILPDDVLKALRQIQEKKYLRKDGTLYETFPDGVVNTSYIDHPLFAPDECLCFINVDSYEKNVLCASGDFKNYTSTIEKFFDWISAYINEVENTNVGFYDSENDEKEAKLIVKNKRIAIIY